MWLQGVDLFIRRIVLFLSRCPEAPMRTLVLSALVSVLVTQTAFAHGGHVGDLAGHSHWLGWAAAAAAGAIAAWAIKRGSRSKASGKDTSDKADNGKETETAEA
jgi:hypothetical protein